MLKQRIVLFIILALFSVLTFPTIAQSEEDSWTIPYTSIGRGQIESVAWYPDNERIFVSTANDVWIYGLDLEVVAHLPNVSFGRLSPNGWYIAGMNDTDAITVWNADTFEIVAVLSENDPRYENYDMEWSPDSRYLASAGRCNVNCTTIWDTETFETAYSLGIDAQVINWNPTGRFAAFHDRSTSTVYVLNPDERTFTSYQPRKDHDGVNSVIWQDETNFYYYAPYAGDPSYIITRVNVVTGEMTTPDVMSDQWVRFAPSAAGFVRIFTATGTLRIWRNEEEIAEIGYQTSGATWSTDGTRLAFGTWSNSDTGAAEVFIFDPLTNEYSRPFGGFGKSIHYISWSPDDGYMAIIDAQNQLVLYDVQEQAVIDRLDTHQQIGGTTAWRPGHGEIAVADSQGGWALWDVQTGTIGSSVTSRRLPYPISSMVWQPEGQMLYASGKDTSFVGWVEPEGLVFDVNQPDSDPLPALTAAAASEAGLLRYFQWNPVRPEIVIYSGGQTQRRIIVWSLTDDQLTTEFPVEPQEANEDFAGSHTLISPSGRYLLLVCYYSGRCPAFIQNLENGGHASHTLLDTRYTYVWGENDSLIALSWWVHAHNYYYGRYDLDIRAFPPAEFALSIDNSRAIQGFHNKVRVGFLSPHGTYFAGLDEQNSGFVGLSENRNPLFMLDNVANVVWSLDESHLVVQRTDGAIWLMESDGTIIAELDRPRGFNHASGEFVWSPEGDRLALVNAGYVLMWDVAQ